jgi:hypothetical protein
MMSPIATTEMPAIHGAGRGRSRVGAHPPGPPGEARRRAPRAPLVALLIGALIAATPRPAGAWGRLGHRASARLAESRLSPRARAIVRELLDPGESLADASTWADEHSREIRGSSSWHYVNVPITSPHYSPEYCGRPGCVVSKIAEFRAVLADRRAPRPRRRQALRFFVHLVQDLHQPMHVADRGDRGGNALQLRLGRHEPTNLHQVWDSGLFHARYRHHAEDTLLGEATALADRPEALRWPRGRVEDWADESLQIGRRAYLIPGTGRPLRPGEEIGPDYVEANLPLAVERVARSGVRLAAMLNEILD